MRARHHHQASLFHGSCETHEGYGFGCADFEDFRQYYGDTCALCGITKRRMAIDHDHAVTRGNPVRGLLCLACNSGEISHVDRGIVPIDETVREYLRHPYRLRGGLLPYDPRVHVSVVDLTPTDQAELDRLAPLSPFLPVCGVVERVRDADPAFEHPRVAECLAHGDIRPVLRLIWMLNHRYLDVDIADPTCGGRRAARDWPGFRIYVDDRDAAMWRRAERVARKRRISIEALLVEALTHDVGIQHELHRASTVEAGQP